MRKSSNIWKTHTIFLNNPRVKDEITMKFGKYLELNAIFKWPAISELGDAVENVLTRFRFLFQIVNVYIRGGEKQKTKKKGLRSVS